VIEALAADPRTAEAAIEVIAEQGVVMLEGKQKDREYERRQRQSLQAGQASWR